MFVLIHFFTWFFDWLSVEDPQVDEEMNFVRLLKSNIAKTSCIVANLSKAHANCTSEARLWPVWLTWKSSTINSQNDNQQCPTIKFNSYQLFTCSNKLRLDRDILSELNFKFIHGCKNSRKQRHIFLVLTKLLVNDNIVKQHDSIKLEEYFNIIAERDETYFIAGYEDEKKLMEFCHQILKKDSTCISEQAFLSLTSFDLEDYHTVSSQSNYNKKLSAECNLTHSQQMSTVSTQPSGGLGGDKLADLGNNMASLTISGKPPNILVYTGSNEDTPEKFKSLKSLLLQCICNERYVIYHLKREQLTTTPWKENAVLLVLATDLTPSDISESVMAYFVNGGAIVSLTCSFDEMFLKRMVLENVKDTFNLLTFSYKDWKNVTVFGGSSFYESFVSNDEDTFTVIPLAFDSKFARPVVALAKHNNSLGLALLSLINFEKNVTETTVSEEEFVALKHSNPYRLEVFRDFLSTMGLNCELSSLPSLSPLILNANEAYNKSTKVITDTYLPVINEANGSHCQFNFDEYEKCLETSVLGNVVLFGQVVTTTMTTIDSFMNIMPPSLGLVAIGTIQTAGQGRGGNIWLSPKGCAMFSMHIRFPLESPLGKHISCIQHLIALAAVLSVRNKKGYEDIKLNIKWPNDIYFSDKFKLGGILTRSTVLHDIVHINLGCGLNISNKDPTVCVNDVIVQHNNSCSDKAEHLPLFTVEEFIGRMITEIEHLVDKFQEDCGDSFFELYYKYWLHNNQAVTLNNINGPKGNVIGLTEYGFLSVRLEDGTIEEVHPDGNSFDMMKNLIAPKIRL